MFAVRLLAVLLLASAATLCAHAAGGGGGGGSGSGGTGSQPAVDPQFKAGVDAIEARRYDQAIEKLEAYVARAPENARDADAQNWLGYAYRKSGNLDAAFLHYDKALAINPRHRGAHEYLGEAYLMVGNLDKADEHLRILDKLCWLPCEEFTMLKKAVADYRVAHAGDAGPGVAAASTQSP